MSAENTVAQIFAAEGMADSAQDLRQLSAAAGGWAARRCWSSWHRA